MDGETINGALMEWLNLFWVQLTETPLLQWIGVAFGVAEVFLARANKVSLYPCGIISVLITIYVLWAAGLYAEVFLNFYYLIMSIYGWWFWLHRPGGAAVSISRSGKRDWSVTLVIVILGTPLVYFVLLTATDSTVPLWDAWVTSTAWAGMWLLARRKIENWILLNLSNASAVPLLIHKDLALYALLTLFLFVIAIFGYIDWLRKLKGESSPTK